MITAYLTPDILDDGVKHPHVWEHTARVFLVFEQIRSNLSSYTTWKDKSHATL